MPAHRVVGSESSPLSSRVCGEVLSDFQLVYCCKQSTYSVHELSNSHEREVHPMVNWGWPLTLVVYQTAKGELTFRFVFTNAKNCNFRLISSISLINLL